MSHEDERLTLLLCRSSAGGKHAQTKKIVEFVMDQAGRAFARADDKAAKTLRELGNTLRLWENEATLELDRLNREAAQHPPDSPEGGAADG